MKCCPHVVDQHIAETAVREISGKAMTLSKVIYLFLLDI